MATISSLLASSLVQLLCLQLAAAAKHQPQEQTTPASPPITLAGCPDKCGNVSIPFPFGTKEGCFLPGFLVFCNDTFDPPRPFINPELDDSPGYDYWNWKTRIVVEDLYYLTSEDGTPTGATEPEQSAWPIELVGVSLSEGKARVLGAFSYDIRLNETHRKVRRQSIYFSESPVWSSPFLVSADDNVLIGISKSAVAEDTYLRVSCDSYSESYSDPNFAPTPPVNGSCTGQGCCQVYLPPDVDISFSEVIVNSTSYLYPDVVPTPTP